METPQIDNDFQVPQTEPDDSFHVILTRSTDPTTCTFWISLYKQGSMSSQRFLQAGKLDDALSVLYSQGLAETRPLMLSDNSGEQHKQYFLLPEEIFQRNPTDAKALILNTLKDLAQEKVGFYFCPTVIGLEESVNFLSDILKGLSLQRVREAYLYTGEIGVSRLLNAALSVKKEIHGHRDVWVFH